MNVNGARPPQLFDLLAREWTLSSPVDAVVFNRSCATAAITCEDGSIALAETADEDSPTSRIRSAIDTGRQTIHRRGGPVAPLIDVEAAETRTTPVVPWEKDNFLFGCADGQIMAITPDGGLLPCAHRVSGPIAAVSTSPAHRKFAAATSNLIEIRQWENEAAECAITVEHPVFDLAFSPDGGRIAAAHEGGVSVWEISGKPVKSQQQSLGTRPEKVRWSPNGQWIAYTSEAKGFCLIDLKHNQARNFDDFPAAIRSLEFSKPANVVAASGAFRATSWSLDNPLTSRESCRAVRSGKPGFVSVNNIATSPDRDLLAVGYANGLLCLTKIGSKDEMLLRQNDDTSISALSWSTDGSFLAVGTANGKAALVEFPIGMFK